MGECNCTWTSVVKVQSAVASYNGGLFCGSTEMPGASNFPLQRAICCGMEFDTIASAPIDCGLVIDHQGPAATAVRKFANDEGKWITKFLQAWQIATTNGFSLKRLET